MCALCFAPHVIELFFAEGEMLCAHKGRACRDRSVSIFDCARSSFRRIRSKSRVNLVKLACKKKHKILKTEVSWDFLVHGLVHGTMH